ncbi:hypothetical protein PMSD_11735 [Paenibacillus macquariensis subsp. defensor]|nr:hypothetical protein PMSD_11735 [Paenibacillus macquariensis subsp. defensor]
MKSLIKQSLTITVAELAEMYGVSLKTARNWCLHEKTPLPSFKVGNIRRIRKEALIAWIEEREKGAII